MSDVELLIKILALLEKLLFRDGWGPETVDIQAEWAEVHEALNGFLSPLEIRKLVWEYENEK